MRSLRREAALLVFSQRVRSRRVSVPCECLSDVYRIHSSLRTPKKTEARQANQKDADFKADTGEIKSKFVVKTDMCSDV